MEVTAFSCHNHCVLLSWVIGGHIQLAGSAVDLFRCNSWGLSTNWTLRALTQCCTQAPGVDIVSTVVEADGVDIVERTQTHWTAVSSFIYLHWLGSISIVWQYFIMDCSRAGTSAGHLHSE